MKRPALGAAIAMVIGAAGVARTQPGLARTVHSVKERDDIVVLPPPSELQAWTLGWDAAAVDLLWARLLVAYGTHWAEHRDFKDVPRYADAILELEPTYAPLYRFIDTMLAYRPMQGTEDDVRKARAYLERGTRERSQDARLWMEYGQFVAFIAPSFLSTDAEREAWRKAGAEGIGHAIELGGDADRALTVATLLTGAGATGEAVQYLERAYAFTEHPSMAEVHEALGRRLAMLKASEMVDAADATARAIDARWRREMPSATRDQYLLLGPRVDPARCSGVTPDGDVACARDWVSALASPGSSPGSYGDSP